jgi:hypothetical protein
MIEKPEVPEKLIELLEQLSIAAHGNGLDLEDIKATPEEEKNMGDRTVEIAIRDIADYIKSVADAYTNDTKYIKELEQEIVDLKLEIKDLENRGE